MPHIEIRSVEQILVDRQVAETALAKAKTKADAVRADYAAAVVREGFRMIFV